MADRLDILKAARGVLLERFAALPESERDALARAIATKAGAEPHEFDRDVVGRLKDMASTLRSQKAITTASFKQMAFDVATLLYAVGEQDYPPRSESQ